MTAILQTERLTLRAFNLADAPFIIELVNSEGWLKYIGDRNIKTIKQAEKYLINGPIKSYADNGFGLSMVELRDSKTPIGMCGLIKRTSLAHVDIGFAFLESYMGQGYAFEISEAVMQFAQKNLQLETVIAIVMPTNMRSIKLLKKIGMTFRKNFTFVENEDALLLFARRTRIHKN